jgi:hypothetical protein
MSVLVKGGRLYWFLPFRKDSLAERISFLLKRNSSRDATTPSILTIRITTLSTLTTKNNDTQHNDIQHSGSQHVGLKCDTQQNHQA